jgi:hypothetical protein
MSVCTGCKRMVQTSKMKMGRTKTYNKLLCPDCLEKNKALQIANALVEEKRQQEDNLDPEMKKLKERLEKAGLM